MASTNRQNQTASSHRNLEIILWAILLVALAATLEVLLEAVAQPVDEVVVAEVVIQHQLRRCAFIDSSIWDHPKFTCIIPCDVVLLSCTITSDTTVSFPSFTTTLTEYRAKLTTTTSVVVTFPPIITSTIRVFNIKITNSAIQSATYVVWTVTSNSVLRARLTTLEP